MHTHVDMRARTNKCIHVCYHKHMHTQTSLLLEHKVILWSR